MSRPENANMGHGHVYPRPDGMKARCGGPPLCRICSIEANNKAHEETYQKFTVRASAIRKKYSDKGQFIEAGWRIVEELILTAETEAQKAALKKIYFLGAHHLYHTLQAVMTDDGDPTPEQILQAQLVCAELQQWSSGQDWSQYTQGSKPT